MSYLEEFLKFGSYPEVALEKDENEKLKILRDYLDLTVYKDIIERHGIKNTSTIKWLMNSMVKSVAKEASLNKLFLALKSQGQKLSKNTVYGYFSILEDSFFVFALRKFGHSYKGEGLSLPKIYLDDIGFLSLFSIEDYGRRMENAVFLHLLRQKINSPLMAINYWRANGGGEVDFVVRKGRKIKQLIQACYDLSDESTKEREVKSLLSAMDAFSLKEGTIITYDEEGIEEYGKKKIKLVPLWELLLS
ncbi:MAG: DUF4143 domain-containing protein [Candidatus Woesearchaeota archaeon]